MAGKGLATLAGGLALIVVQTASAAPGDRPVAANPLASNRAALGIADPSPQRCTPVGEGRVATCTEDSSAAIGRNRASTLIVLLGAIAAVGLGIAAAAGGGSDPVSP